MDNKENNSSSDTGCIVLFDGVCNLCSGSVSFLIRRDKKKKFMFASLQSDVGKKLVKQYGGVGVIDSFILIKNGKSYIRSNAVVQAGLTLGSYHRLIAILYLLPRFVRDWLYAFVASHRYKWFGKNEACMVPTDDIKDRFID